MAYNTNTYFIFFLPIVFLAYQMTRQKYRWVVLLASSAVFFWLISKYLIGWAALTTVLTWGGGLLMEKLKKEGKGMKREEKKQQKLKMKRILTVFLVAVVAILFVLKYTRFTVGIIGRVVGSLGGDAELFSIGKILVPIGISFYTLQAVGYLLDVYWSRFEAERNVFRVGLFMIFFPTLMEGPIMRWTDTSRQLFAGEPITFDSFEKGAFRILLGLFKRMIIADRLNMAVKMMYRADAEFTGLMILVVMITTTVQLYMEFAGTIDICIGTARILNIRLPENFRQPFYSQSAAEFWRRWHISLGTWFKNYIFYPVSTSSLMKKWNKYGRKHCGKYITTVVTSAIALFPVWMLNGLWHGPKWPYIMYGVFYFVILLAEICLEPVGEAVWKKLHLKTDGWFVVGVRMIRTWCIIFVGEMLFRANTLGQFADLMKSLFTGPWDGGLLYGYFPNVGLEPADGVVAILGSILIFLLDHQAEKDPMLYENINDHHFFCRGMLYYAMIFAIVIFGAYGVGYQPADLIYAGF
ncbi:MAG: MBOAT family protein [Lachnospiraceae bacterium]|nr:MBOAT family protein [Lachnospiraceae bacterium]